LCSRDKLPKNKKAPHTLLSSVKEPLKTKMPLLGVVRGIAIAGMPRLISQKILF
jgi:hypothetical protein